MPKEPNNPALALRDVPMRLSMSAAVANDLGALRRGLKDLAERLGHSACATGCNELHLRVERDFTVDKIKNEVTLNRQAVSPIGLPQDPVPYRPVRVVAPAAVFNDIGSLNSAIEKVLGRLGCGACCSGFDILFQREVDGFVLGPKLDVHGTGRFA